MRYRRVVALVLLPLVLLVACGLPTDNDVVSVDAEIPPFLANTTTTSTTTTTTTTTVAPPASGASTSTTTTSTQPIVEQVPISVYYGPEGVLGEVVEVKLKLVPDVGVDELLEFIESPPNEIRASNLSTSVRTSLVESISVERGTATIDLNPTVLAPMGDSTQTQAIAQLVLTYTTFRPPNSGGIAFVEFTVDGDPYNVIVPGRGTSDGPLTFEDFEPTIRRVGNDPPAPTTRPETTVPATTAAPATSAPATTAPDQ